MWTRRGAIVLGALLAASVLAACIGEQAEEARAPEAGADGGADEATTPTSEPTTSNETTPSRETAPSNDTTPAPNATADENATRVVVDADEFEFRPWLIQAAPGERVTVELRNAGTVAHNLGFRDGPRTATIAPGESDRITFFADEEGAFAFWCDVPGHREAGMEGRFFVETPPPEPPG